MENSSKSRFITPVVMLFAGALSMIIMLIKQYDLYRMLWTLLVVLIVFYIIGDIARYLYSTIRPRVIPASLDLEDMQKQAEIRFMDEDVEYLDDDFTDENINQMKSERKAGAMEEKTQTPDTGYFEGTEEGEADAEETSSFEDETEEYGYSDEELK